MAAAYSLYDAPMLVPRVDYSLGLVFLERWRGDYFIGVERVLPISEYLDYQLAQSVKEAWQEKAEKSQQQQELAADASGLIPEIVLPTLPIFGEGSKIDISGRDRITLGGRQTFVHNTLQLPGASGLFPELKMNQQLAVTLNGTVGERTKVSIDHDSERQEGQNKVMLSYTGTEDDIIQSVELGDTRLTIPSTGYTGDLPAHHGLFGASARGKVGGVDVYAIASREQSESQTQTFSGRRRVSSDTIYEYQYASRRFYYLDAPSTIRDLRVYVDDRNPGNNQSAYKGIATVFPDYPDSVPSNWDYDRATGDFDLKSLGSDYVLHPGNIIEFTTSLNQQDVIGLVVFLEGDTIGGRTWHDSLLVMKMLKSERPDSSSLTWDSELRNYYQLPQGDITLSSFRLQMNSEASQWSETETANANPNYGRKFTDILRLDPNGDGRVEYPEFEAKTGLIRFPGRRPFDTVALSTRDRDIYRIDPMALPYGAGQLYRMVVEYSSTTESYYLGQPKITANTEKVVVDGDRWTANTDYSVNYQTGVLTFLRALPPDANIQVTFEYQPLFSMSQKSLVGGRAEWNMSQQGKIGASVFFRDEGVNLEHPELGSEPFRRTIAEADASWGVASDALSAFLDRLPLLRAQAASSFSASAEGAVSLPDPNTRGTAYLDDFQSTTVTSDVLIAATSWSWASVPVGKDTAQFASTRISWANPLQKVRNDSVFSGLTDDEGRATHDVLRTVFTPDPGNPESWAGMMQSMAQQGVSANLKNVENLRMILRSRRGVGRVHVTVGMSIDEDAPRRTRGGRIAGYDGALNTEDRNSNGALDPTEDTGLDTIQAADSLFGRLDTADDFNDDYDVDNNPMGTEGNNRLDGEDLDRNGFTRYNHYYECDISLGDPRYFSALRNGWQLCLVPLKDSTIFRAVGKPKWEDIREVRVWFDGFDAVDTLDFYSIEFVGSLWSAPTVMALRDSARPPGRVPPDTTEKVWATQISQKTDTSYVPPFEPRRNASGVVEEEAALLLGYRALRGQRSATVSKTAADRDDYREYADMRMYVHDDGNRLSFLLRFGPDSVNFYEYRAKVTDGQLVPGRDGKWYEFVIPLDSFPVLKEFRDRADVPTGSYWSQGRYRIRGSPSLADVRYTALGFEHAGTERVTGGIWFDDLRLSAPRRDAGYGFQARASGSLSDFVTVALNFGYSDPNFRRFSEGRGVKVGGFGTNLAASVRANADRLLPSGWGVSLPFTYSIAEQSDMPKFSPLYPDLLLSREVASSPRYLSSGRSEEMSLDNIRKQKSGNRWLNYTLEAMSASWRQRNAWSRSTLLRDTTSSSAFQWTYAVAPDLKVKIGRETELSLFPQDIRFSVTDGRQQSLRGSRISPDSAYRTDTLRGHGLNTDLGADYSPIEDLTFEYSTQSERDLTVPNPDSLWFLKIGSEASRDHSFNAGYNVEVADIITPALDFSGDYSDDRTKVDASYAPFRNMNNSGELEFTMGLDVPELLGRFEPKVRPQRKPDTLTKPPVEGDSGPPKPPSRRSGGNPLEALGKGVSGLSDVLDPIDFSYSISQNSDLVGVYDRVPWYYLLGFSDLFTFNDTQPPTSANREHRNTLRLSTGGHVKELTARLAYEWSQGKDINGTFNSTALDRGTTWPEIELTQGKLHNLFKKWATDSKLTSSFRRRHDLGGQYVRGDSGVGDTLGMYGRNESFNNEFSPLFSWQTTWKKRVTTTLAANYTFGTSYNFLNDSGTSRNVTDSRDQGLNLTLGYAFSAPQGLKLPFLKKLKFSSDLSLNWTLGLSQTHRWQRRTTGGTPGDSSDLQRDNSFRTSLAASYRFSRSIEAGLNAGYTQTNNMSKVKTETMDLDLWVLFRF
jgi:hypothetical protein